MTKSKLSGILIFALSLLVVGSLAAQGLRHLARQAQEQDFSAAKDSKWITAHRFGVQAQVLNPKDNPLRNRIVRVRDLGPDLADLEEDLPPTSAQLRVNDNPTLDLQFNTQGELEATVPEDWLYLLQKNRAELTVYHQGHLLIKFQLSGMFF